MRKIIFLLCILSVCEMSKGQSGTLDPSFGSGGFVLTPANIAPFPGGTSRRAFVNPDGTILIVLQSGKGIITRRLSNGSIDASYHNNGYSDVVSLTLGSAAIQTDGKIVLAGAATQTSGFMVARYNTDGTLDASFGNNGVTITNFGFQIVYVSSVAVTADGKIIAGGSGTVNGHDQFVVARYSSSGIIDPSFGGGGFVTTDFNTPANLFSLALQSDGKIVAAGTVQLVNQDFALTRYNADGSPDLTFNSTGIVTADFGSFDNASAVVINNDGKIYIGGYCSDASGNHFRIARYNTNGTPDLNFNAGSGSVLAAFGNSSDIMNNMQLQSDGKIVASGYTNLNGNTDEELIRVNTDGSIDDGFGNNGNGLVLGDINSGQDADVFLLTIQPDGKILAGGVSVDFSSATQSAPYTCFRYNQDGSPDIEFGSGGKFADVFRSNYFVYTSAFLQSDGKLLAASGSNIDGNNNLFVNRFNSDGAPDNTYGQNGSVDLNSLATGTSFFQPDGKIIVLNYSNSNPNGYDILLTRYMPDGSLDPSFGTGGIVTTDLGGNESGYKIAFQADGKIVIAGASRDENGSDLLVIRYNPDGSIDGSFGTGGYIKMNFDNEDGPQTVAIGPDGKIVIGVSGYLFPPDFSYFYVDIYFVRLNADGSVDQGFADQGKLLFYRSTTGDFLTSMQILNNNKILFTDYLSINNQGGVTSSLYRFNANGTADTNFGDNGKISCDVGTMILQPDQKILVGGYRGNNEGNLDFALTRFNENGSIDPTFGTNGQTIYSFTGLDNSLFAAFLSGNSLFVAGTGTEKSGAGVGIIAKFKIDDIGSTGSITCPGNQTVNTDDNSCAANVNNIDPTVTPVGATVNYTLTGATTGTGSGSVSGKSFNKGVTTVTYTLSNDATKSCSFTVTVQDKQLPVINNLSVSQTTLWPPDHKLKDITVSYVAADNCGIANTQISVSSDEPVQSRDKDDQSPDWQILDNHHIRLRAERLENGNGRTYSIKVTSTDVSGNKNTSTVTVKVPKSISNPHPSLVVAAAPNPSHNYFWVTINSSSSDKINVRLLNNKGNVLHTMDNITAPQSLKIGERLIPGIYFFEATQSGVTKTLKLIKQ